MKKMILYLSLVAVLAFTMSGCSINLVTGSGRVSAETRNVSGFSSLLFAGLGDVNITQGSTEGLTIEAEDNILPKIITEVRSGQLYIGFERENWQDLIRPTKGITFNLRVRSLDSIEISGVGNISIPAYKADQLELKVGGAGNIKVGALTVGTLTATMSGAGNVDLTGKATNLSATMSGVGNCYDNAVAESFFATLKTECVKGVFPTRAEARTTIFEYLEVWYNRQRLHSTLGYHSPVDFERHYLTL